MRDYLIGQLDSVARQRMLVYLMGPYTTMDLDYFLGDDTDIESEDMDFGAFNPEDEMRDVLYDLVEVLRNDSPQVNAFIALDANIPTPARAPPNRKEAALDSVTQSIRFAKASNAVAFILPKGGLRDGVDTEIGSVLENNLSPPSRRSTDRYQIFKEKGVSSATINSVEHRWDVPITKFETRSELELAIRNFILKIVLGEQDGDLSDLDSS